MDTKKNKNFLNYPPLGYKVTFINTKRTLTIDEKIGSALKDIFELYSTGNYSVPHLHQYLLEKHQMDIPRTTIYDLLDNKIYAGFYSTGDPHPYPSLISLELFNKIKNIKNTRSAPYPSVRSYNFIYKSLIKCDKCGGLLVGQLKKNVGYYYCSSSRNKCFPKSYIREKSINEQLMPVFDLFNLNENCRTHPSKLKLFFQLVFEKITSVEKIIHYQLRPNLSILTISDYINNLSDEEAINEGSNYKGNNPILKLCRIPHALEEISDKLNIDLQSLQAEIIDLSFENLIQQNETGKWKTI